MFVFHRNNQYSQLQHLPRKKNKRATNQLLRRFHACFYHWSVHRINSWGVRQFPWQIFLAPQVPAAAQRAPPFAAGELAADLPSDAAGCTEARRRSLAATPDLGFCHLLSVSTGSVGSAERFLVSRCPYLPATQDIGGVWEGMGGGGGVRGGGIEIRTSQHKRFSLAKNKD